MNEQPRDPAQSEAWGDVHMPVVGTNYTWLPLGPGNEAMEGGASPAPRGYTGGAMGRVVAGLSGSFSEAARGAPPVGGPGLYTPAEAATTFRGTERDAPPGAGHTPGPTPMDAQGDPDERAGGPTQA